MRLTPCMYKIGYVPVFRRLERYQSPLQPTISNVIKFYRVMYSEGVLSNPCTTGVVVKRDF